ncbi:hypothetical protein [Nostoc sp.]|uniref:hypothetical protein n=1 Tax=Nostoc sp. TaxID=1180 RepID=UPI002FF60E99
MRDLDDSNQSIDRVIISKLDTDAYPESFDGEMARKLAGLTQEAYKQFNLFSLKKNLQRFQLENLFQLNTE